MIPNKPPLGQKIVICILIFSVIPVMLMTIVSLHSFSAYHNNMGKDISLAISMIERTHRGGNPELIYMLDDMGKKSEAMSNRYKTLIIIISFCCLSTAILTGLVFIKNENRAHTTVPQNMNAAFNSDSLEKDLTQLRDNIDLLIQMLKKIR